KTEKNWALSRSGRMANYTWRSTASLSCTTSFQTKTPPRGHDSTCFNNSRLKAEHQARWVFLTSSKTSRPPYKGRLSPSPAPVSDPQLTSMERVVFLILKLTPGILPTGKALHFRLTPPHNINTRRPVPITCPL